MRAEHLQRVDAVNPIMVEMAEGTRRRMEAESVGADTCDVAVFDGTVPKTLPDVPSLFLEPSTDGPLWTLGESVRKVLITSVEEDSPLVRHTRWDRVMIHQAIALVPEGGETILASFEVPLLQAWERNGVKYAALSIDMARTDLPLRTAFPVLMANLVS